MSPKWGNCERKNVQLFDCYATIILQWWKKSCRGISWNYITTKCWVEPTQVACQPTSSVTKTQAHCRKDSQHHITPWTLLFPKSQFPGLKHGRKRHANHFVVEICDLMAHNGRFLDPDDWRWSFLLGPSFHISGMGDVLNHLQEGELVALYLLQLASLDLRASWTER